MQCFWIVSYSILSSSASPGDWLEVTPFWFVARGSRRRRRREMTRKPGHQQARDRRTFKPSRVRSGIGRELRQEDASRNQVWTLSAAQSSKRRSSAKGVNGDGRQVRARARPYGTIKPLIVSNRTKTHVCGLTSKQVERQRLA
jgi:hypothetical protein